MISRPPGTNHFVELRPFREQASKYIFHLGPRITFVAIQYGLLSENEKWHLLLQHKSYCCFLAPWYWTPAFYSGKQGQDRSQDLVEAGTECGTDPTGNLLTRHKLKITCQDKPGNLFSRSSGPSPLDLSHDIGYESPSFGAQGGFTY